MAKIWIPKSWSGTNPPASGQRVFVGGKGAGKGSYESISAGQTKRCLQSNGRGSVFYGNVSIASPGDPTYSSDINLGNYTQLVIYLPDDTSSTIPNRKIRLDHAEDFTSRITSGKGALNYTGYTLSSGTNVTGLVDSTAIIFFRIPKSEFNASLVKKVTFDIDLTPSGLGKGWITMQVSSYTQNDSTATIAGMLYRYSGLDVKNRNFGITRTWRNDGFNYFRIYLNSKW